MSRPPKIEDPLARLAWLLSVYYVEVDGHALRDGCRCGSCNCYEIRWEDREDRPQKVQADFLPDAINLAWEHMEFWRDE
jgi:hypothetical protein